MKNLEIEDIYKIYTENTQGVCTDTRNIIPGSMFFALRGETFNGNDFIPDALAKGAAYAVADEEAAEVADTERVILVDNVLETLQQLSRHHRKQFKIPVIALTGTNGKTTTKELLSTVLSRKYNVTFTQGNLNNHIGVPLTLLRITEETEAAVVEMGANHPGEIALLMSIALPNFGLVTNVGKAHLEGFGSFEGVMAAKGEMYDYLQRTADKVFYNCDDEYISAMVSSRPDLTGYRYGIQYNSAEILPVSQQEPYLRLKFSIEGEQKEISSKLVGSYNANNILAAVTVGV